jgi:D-glycero-D-manno-heptose 1,7-bisphosphate phosphatase
MRAPDASVDGIALMKRRAAFLDRDGVLNVATMRDGVSHPPDCADAAERLPGVEGACRRLADAGWVLVVVTNQPDVARGTCTLETVDAINAKITAGLPITETVVCPHDDADDCACRKPRPGMLLAAASRWDIDLAASVMIGDRWRDIEAGRAAGTRTFFVEHGDSSPITCRPDHVVDSLTAAAELILRAGVIA